MIIGNTYDPRLMMVLLMIFWLYGGVKAIRGEHISKFEL